MEFTVTVLMTTVFESVDGTVCASCTDRSKDGFQCLSWNFVECASIYGPKPVVCVFYPSLAKNSLQLPLNEQDRFCMSEEKMKALYNVSSNGDGSCALGANDTAPYVCSCAGNACNSNAGIRRWIEKLSTTSRPATITTATGAVKKCKCCCDETGTSAGHSWTLWRHRALYLWIVYFSRQRLI